jgi:hypothetical protein
LRSVSLQSAMLSQHCFPRCVVGAWMLVLVSPDGCHEAGHRNIVLLGMGCANRQCLKICGSIRQSSETSGSVQWNVHVGAIVRADVLAVSPTLVVMLL